MQLNKFKEDKVFEEDNDLILGIDGVILNLSDLKNKYGISSYIELVKHLFNKRNLQFVDELKGYYCGFIFEKRTEQLFFFNNKIDTKQIFYASNGNEFIVSNFFDEVCSFKKSNSINETAVYEMLSFGGVLENKTFVHGISKLLAGEYLTFCQGKMELSTYYNYNDIPISIFSKKEAINKFDEAFREAVRLEFSKDEAYNLPHLTTLSGGLDSRMTLLVALELGYQTSTFCFSQSAYDDELIAKEIAQDLNLEFKFVALDGSPYLKDLEKLVSINAGLQFYNGSAHYNFALEQMNLSNFGLIHTGQIGDALLGGLVTKDKNFLSKSISNKYLNKFSYSKNYRDEEVFKMYNRIFNLTNFGSFVVEKNGTYLTSPFFDDDVMKIGLSIDPKLKYNQEIYIDWINKKYPKAVKYKWERTGLKPNAHWKTAIAKYTKKIVFISKKLRGEKQLLSMTPDDYWFQKSNDLQNFYQTYFSKNLSMLENNKSLQNNLKSYYENGNLDQKSVVLTLLEVIRKYEIEI